jgi:dolichol-phosphate mannosyltransferase
MLYIVLPAYNEEEALPTLLEDIVLTCANTQHRIVVVNDGSTDSTEEIVNRYVQKNSNIHGVSHDLNQGLGAALNSGFQYVLKLHHHDDQVVDSVEKAVPDIVVTMDSDNTQPPDHIPLLCEAICLGADLAIASRFVNGGEQHGLSLGRRLLSWGAGKIMSFFVPIRGVRDYSCGFRAYRLKLLEEGTRHYGPEIIKSSNFSGMVELLLKLAPLTEEVTEVPLKLHYELKKGASKMKILATIWGYCQLIYEIKRQKWSRVEWVEE